MEKNQLIFNYFIQNQQRLKVLLQPIRSDFGYLIDMKEAETAAMWVIACDICYNLKVGVDSSLEFLYSVNIGEMLK